MRRLHAWIAPLTAAWCLAAALPVVAAVPTENLLPDTTKGYISVANLEILREHWDKCQLGQLTNDPLMQAFVEDFRTQIKHKWHTMHQDLGLAIEDLDGVPGGEFCFAMLQPEKGKYSVVILVDATGHDPQAKALLQKVTTNLTNLKAARIDAKDLKDRDIAAFDLQKHDAADKRNRQAAYFYKNNWLCFADSVTEVKAIYARLTGAAQGGVLAQLPAFRKVMDRCSADAVVNLAPHARWFLEPFGYIEAVRVYNPPVARAKGQPDMLKILREQGFNCIQGLGGYVNFYVELKQHAYDVLHHTYVYAPGTKVLAARMLKFANGGDFGPQPWVPRDLATYTTLNVDIQNAFQQSAPDKHDAPAGQLIDAVIGEKGAFDDMIDNFRDDPNGIRIDIRKDLIANLGSRVSILTDYQMPITTKSERTLVGVNIAQNEKALTELVRRAVENEKHNKFDFEGHTIWEIINESGKKTQQIEIEIPGLDNGQVAAPKKPEEEGGLPNSAVCIAYGHMFVSTHVDIMKKMLHQGGLGKEGEETSLAHSADYRLVMGELARLGAADNIQCAKLFSRTDEEYRTTYELLRAGKMPEAETMLGRFLNALLSEKEGETRHQKIDGKNLPEYDVARRYFGPAGVAVSSEQEGWYMVGFMLTKEAPAAE